MTLRDLLGKLGYGHLGFTLHPAVLSLKLTAIRQILTAIEEAQ